MPRKFIQRWAVIPTDRNWLELIEALHKDQKAAIADAAVLAAACPGRYIRVLVRQVWLTENELVALVRAWGGRDKEAGVEPDRAEQLTGIWRQHYLEGYQGLL